MEGYCFIDWNNNVWKCITDWSTVCYDLEDAVVDQLVFVYCVFIGETGNQINIEIFTNNDTIVGTKYNHNNKDSTVSKVPLTIYWWY